MILCDSIVLNIAEFHHLEYNLWFVFLSLPPDDISVGISTQNFVGAGEVEQFINRSFGGAAGIDTITFK